MLKLILATKKSNISNGRCCSTAKENVIQSKTEQNSSIYETVFSFPFVKYIATFNRLKVYHLTGTSLAMPGCALMEIFNVLPQGAFFTAAYIGEPLINCLISLWMCQIYYHHALRVPR